MSVYNYFLTHPFGPGKRTLEWIYLRHEGGTDTDLDAELTYTQASDGTNCRIVALNSTTAEVWQLVDGINATGGDYQRPLDFDSSNNAKVWHRLSCFSTGGGPGGAVSSVFTRTGDVVAAAGDYAAFYASLTGSYSNPVWIASLAWSKITGVPAFEVPLTFQQSIARAGNVVNLVNDLATPGNSKYYGTDGSGTKGFFGLPPNAVSSVFTRTGAIVAVSGDYSAFYPLLAGSYADPAWITSLAYSKLTGVPAALVTSVFTRTGAIVAAAGDYASFYASLTGSYADPAWITALAWSKLTGVPSFEPALGNPTVNGYILSSTIAGVRSWIAPVSAPTGQALTKVDDTNVTLALGGSPATALLAAASLTLGWTGVLAVARGGIGVATAGAHQFLGNNTGSSAAPGFVQPALTDLVAPTADFSMNSHKLTSVTDPTLAQDVATKAYVDAKPPNKVVFISASTTYTPSTGVRALLIEVWGGGGAGGGGASTVAGNNSEGSGGGGGGYSMSYIASPAASYVVTIGAGGTGVSGAAGNPGGATSVGGVCAATGGSAGGAQGATATTIVGGPGGAGGGGSVGDWKLTGQQGEGILVFAGAGFQARGGAGGDGAGGGGGGGRGVNSTTNVANTGTAGNLPGGGGGGGCVNGTGGNATGGAGAAGAVRIREFF